MNKLEKYTITGGVFFVFGMLAMMIVSILGEAEEWAWMGSLVPVTAFIQIFGMVIAAYGILIHIWGGSDDNG